MLWAQARSRRRGGILPSFEEILSDLDSQMLTCASIHNFLKLGEISTHGTGCEDSFKILELLSSSRFDIN
jgi:hypothetical protein